jgi:hypothetical protein
VQDDRLIRAEGGAGSDAEQEGITDLAGRAGDRHAKRSFVHKFLEGQYGNTGDSAQVFRERKILLGNPANQRTKRALFESADFFRTQRSQMSGNPVRIRDGCATVTATNSQCHWIR